MGRLGALLLLGCTLMLGQVRVPGTDVLEQVGKLRADNQLEAAIRLLKSEVSKEPNNLSFRFALSQLYRENEQYDDAIAVLREASREDPLVGAAIDINVAFGNFRKGDRKTAAELTRRAVNASGPNYGYMINFSVSITEVEFSEILDEELYRLHPEDGLVANNLSYTLAQQNKQLPRALELAIYAIGKSPNEPPVIDTLGWVYYMQGKFDQALPLLCRALAMEADSQAYQRHVMRVLDSMPKLTTRQRDLRDWLRADDDPEREIRLQILAQELAQ